MNTELYNIAAHYRSLEKDLDWFVKLYSDEMRSEGWGIDRVVIRTDINDAALSYTIYGVKNFVYDSTNRMSYNISKEQSKEYAIQYGMTLNECDYIINFDKNKITRNRYLVDGVDLNLI